MKKVYRSSTDRWFGGIFGGAGRTFEIDPTIIRLLALYLGIATGIIPLAITYLVAWIVIPYGPIEAQSQNP
jgi:phage shock protein C